MYQISRCVSLSTNLLSTVSLCSWRYGMHKLFTEETEEYYTELEYNNRVDVRGCKYVFGPTQIHFSPSKARDKMCLRRAKNILTPKNINFITIIITLKGILKRNMIFKIN